MQFNFADVDWWSAATILVFYILIAFVGVQHRARPPHPSIHTTQFHQLFGHIYPIVHSRRTNACRSVPVCGNGESVVYRSRWGHV
jgi:hypothetical protein